MKLITKEIAALLPQLYSNEHKTAETTKVPLKLFTASSNWTWYITEWDGDDTMFGYVVGLDEELGYVSLSELQAIRDPLGLPIERDRYWNPNTTLHEVMIGKKR